MAARELHTMELNFVSWERGYREGYRETRMIIQGLITRYKDGSLTHEEFLEKLSKI